MHVLVFTKILAHGIRGFLLLLKYVIHFAAPLICFLKKPTILDILIVAVHLPRGLQLILDKDAISFDFIYLLLDYKCNSIYMYMFFFSVKSS